MYADLYEALPRAVARDSGVSWERRGGLLTLTCRGADHPFFNRVMGAPGARERLAAELADIVAHFRQQGVSRWMLQVARGDSTPALEAACSAHGLVSLRGWTKHAGAVERIAPAEERTSDLRVESIGPDRAAQWASIIVPSFAFPAGSEDWPAATVGRPGWHHYLAYDGDRPAACAAMFVADRIATLGFAATLPEYRRRGAQTGLIAARIADARELPVRWLATETDEELPERPNPSFRNVVRAGLPALYVRANWGPPPPVAQ